MSTLTKTDWLLIGLIMVLAVVIRWWAIRDNHVFFHFDQARDAFVARSIIQDKDLKIQGPSASGTNETIYHGVLYYYVITPLYTVLGGNPFLVTQALAVLGASAVVPIYWLVKDLTDSRASAVVVSILTAISFEQIQASTWLSNPMLVVFLGAWFYLCLWQVCFKSNWQWWPALALTLGLTFQAVLVMVFLWWSLVAGLIWQARYTSKKLHKAWGFKRIFGFFLVYGFTISTMILVQLKLWLSGIFTLEKLAAATTNHPANTTTDIYGVLDLYVHKAGLAILPSWPVASLVCCVIALWYLTKLPAHQKWFLSSWLLAPLGLLAFQGHNAYHALLGLEVPLFILLTLLLMQKWPKVSQTLKMTLTLFTIGIFTFSQVTAITSFRNHALTSFSVEDGLFLKQQLATVDSLYQQAQTQPFSLATLTTPYGYNMTWAYLLSWYAQPKYAQLPLWAGNSQERTLWATTLVATSSALPTHFTIEEKVSGIESWLRSDFYNQQPPQSSSSTQTTFGSMFVTSY